MLVILNETQGQKKRDSCQNLSMCHWNLNNITAHNFSKLTLLEAYSMKYNFGITCLSEKHLDSYIQHDDEILYLSGWNLVRADNPDNNKRVGICVSFK